jgi:PTH1 family peptidyl-tRNA hydrolase
MYVIVGLGNPGAKYAKTRHNVGFDAIDRLADLHGIKVNKIKYKALVGEGFIKGERVMLVKPQTFMNLSGETVHKIFSYHKLPIENLIVIYDDVDTEFAKLRIRKKGSAGTHNGMRHIIYMLQKEDFPRIRIGIGKSDRIPLRDFVLQKFSKEEAAFMNDAIDRAAKSVDAILAEGIEKAMNTYNG